MLIAFDGGKLFMQLTVVNGFSAWNSLWFHSFYFMMNFMDVVVQFLMHSRVQYCKTLFSPTGYRIRFYEFQYQEILPYFYYKKKYSSMNQHYLPSYQCDQSPSRIFWTFSTAHRIVQFWTEKNKGQESGTGPTNKNNQNIVRTFWTWCSVHTSAFYAVH